MKSIAVLLFAFLLGCVIAQAKKNTQPVNPNGSLVQVQIISRHCDRLPSASSKIPADPIDWQLVSGLALGDLTGLGQQQCRELGEHLRERYLSEDASSRISGITANYNASMYSFRSTNFDRALNSMQTIALGLFPDKTGDRATVNYLAKNDKGKKKWALPHGQQAVPIHTVADDYENLLLGFTYCNTVQKRYNTAFGTKALAYLNANRTFVNQLYTATGWTTGDLTISTLIDLLIVQKAHNMLNIKWVNDNWTQVLKMRDDVLSLLYSYDVMGKEGSSVLIQTLIENMNSLNKKYIHYSAHDSTLQALTGSLKLNQDSDYAFLGGQPNYGAHIVAELYQTAAGNKTVRFMHGNQFDSTSLTPLVLKNLGCQTEYCPLETFTQLTSQYSTTTNWCVDCANKGKVVCAPYFLSVVTPCTSTN